MGSHSIAFESVSVGGVGTFKRLPYVARPSANASLLHRREDLIEDGPRPSSPVTTPPVFRCRGHQPVRNRVLLGRPDAASSMRPPRVQDASHTAFDGAMTPPRSISSAVPSARAYLFATAYQLLHEGLGAAGGSEAPMGASPCQRHPVMKVCTYVSDLMPDCSLVIALSSRRAGPRTPPPWALVIALSSGRAGPRTPPPWKPRPRLYIVAEVFPASAKRKAERNYR